MVLLLMTDFSNYEQVLVRLAYQEFRIFEEMYPGIEYLC